MKKIFATMLAAAMILSLTACKDNTSSDVISGADSEVSSDVSTPADESSADISSDVEEEPIEEIPYTLGGELTPTMIANSRLNVGNRVRLAEVIKRLQAGEEVTIAYLGGSITQGSSAGDDLCYARLTTNWFEETFPSAKINYVRAGIGATGSYIGVHRAETDVLAHEPDLVFIDFSVNDTSDRTALNKSTYEGLLRKLWLDESAPAIVTIAMTQENGTSFQEHHLEIVQKYDIPMISYKNAILDVINKGYIKWTDISGDNIHPNVPGHAILTDLITAYIQDTMDNLDSITGEESDFSAVSESGLKYQNASLLNSANTTPASLGGFAIRETNLGGFNNPWLIRASDGQFTEEDAIVFEVEAMNIGILYGKTVHNGCMADVYVDDKLMATLNSDFSGGWGNYVEFAEVATFITEGAHTVKIVPRSAEGAIAFYVSAIAIS